MGLSRTTPLHRWQTCVTPIQPRSSRERCLYLRWTKEKMCESSSTGSFEIGASLFRSDCRARMRSHQSSISLSMTRQASKLEAPTFELDPKFLEVFWCFEVSYYSLESRTSKTQMKLTCAPLAIRAPLAIPAPLVISAHGLSNPLGQKKRRSRRPRAERISKDAFQVVAEETKKKYRNSNFFSS